MAKRSKINTVVKRLKLIIAILVVVIAALAIYIIYPAYQLSVKGQPYGERLTGIDAPIISSQLAAINSAPNSDFEIAGEMLLNDSLPGEVIQNDTYTGPLFE